MNDLIQSSGALPVTEKQALLPATQKTMPPDSEALLKTAVLLLQGLSYNVMSGDVWALAQFYAASRAEEAGVNPEDLEKAMERLLKMVKANRSTNPMASMF